MKLARRLKRTVRRHVGVYVDEARDGATGDTTYEVDEPMEAAVTEYFTDIDIPCRVMTEDAGVRDFGEDPEYIFLIDPLDGSRNARRGLPLYCCSIAAYEAGAGELSEAVCGVIERFDAPGEYVAVRGRGASLNGKPISPSPKTTTEDAIIALGCHFVGAVPKFSDAALKLSELSARDDRSVMVKCYGSTALELAFLASGKIDMIYDLRAAVGFRAGLKTYDVAAGILICRESGAVVEYGRGSIPEELPVSPYIPVQILGAGNRVLFKRLTNTLR